MQLQGLATGDLLSQVLAQIRLTGDRVYSSRLRGKERMVLEARAAYLGSQRNRIWMARWTF